MNSSPTSSALGGNVLSNTRWNFAGLFFAIALALVATPFIIHGLGTERFGLLALAWAVMGYFYLLDLGLGQATIKFVSEAAAHGTSTEIHSVVRTALFGHLVMGVTGGILLALAAPWLTYSVFNIPSELQNEGLWTFLLMAVSVPIVIVSTCLRGALEGCQLFKVVNLTKMAGSVLTYASPLVAMPFTKNLIAVIALIVAGRAVILFIYLFAFLTNVPRVVSSRAEPDRRLLTRMFKFGGWMTVSTLTTPLISCIDRTFIASAFTLSAVAFYATPYEIVTKLWIFSASLMGSLFPVFAALAVRDIPAVRGLCRDALLFLVFVATPIVGVVIVFARDLLTLWINANFGYESAAIAKWLTVGVYINVLAQVPYTALISTGRARQVARIQIFELACYVLLAWHLIWNYSAMGAAMAWTIRSVLDALLLTAAAQWTFGRSHVRRAWRMAYLLIMPLLFLAACYFVDSRLKDQFQLKCLLALALISLFVMWEHVVLTQYEEHVRVRSWFAQLLSLRRPS